jgi:hypothetical protein
MLRSAAVFIVAIIVLLVAFYFAERSFSPAFQTCVEKHQAADSNRIAEDDITGRWISLVEHSIRCSGEFVEANSAAITALAAILVAAFTASLWIATGRQAKLTRQAVMAGKRAFVFPTGVVALPESNAQTGSFQWRLVPAWENSGETPTRNLRIYADCILTNVPLPESFSFTQIDPEEPPAMGAKSNEQRRHCSARRRPGTHTARHPGYPERAEILVFMGLGQVLRFVAQYARTHHQILLADYRRRQSSHLQSTYGPPRPALEQYPSAARQLRRR